MGDGAGSWIMGSPVFPGVNLEKKPSEDHLPPGYVGDGRARVNKQELEASQPISACWTSPSSSAGLRSGLLDTGRRL